MIATLLVWIYILVLSYSWGTIFLNLTYKRHLDDHQHNIHFSIVCLAGISIIGTICGILSLVMPLGNWFVHLLVLLPCLKVIPGSIYKLKIKLLFAGYPIILKLLMATFIAIILLMTTWVIEHPDTVSYQVQITKWIEEYGTVPGIANINTRFGYQNIWFCLTAFFSLKFTLIGHYIYLNSFITFLAVIFLIDRIHYNYQQKKLALFTLLWTLLLLMSFLSYTQIRLTASSTSSDYICTLYIFVTIYLLYNTKTVDHGLIKNLIILFSIFSVTVKLSAAPILIISLYLILTGLKSRSYKQILTSLAIPSLLVFGFLARNAISSGYLLYPSPIPDLLSPEWKLKKKSVTDESSYITIYARIQYPYTDEKISLVKEMTITQWLPVWWEQKKITDKLIILLLLAAFISSVVRLPGAYKQNGIYFVCLLTCLAGVTFWFVKAPDPRFGYGFIISLLGVESIRLPGKKFLSRWAQERIRLLFFLVIIIFSGYIAYRCIYYVNIRQIIQPMGIKKTGYISVKCEGIEFNIAAPGDCGEVPLPCSEQPCDKLLPIGKKISDGFKPTE